MNQERDLDRTHHTTAAPVVADDLVPGRASRSSQLASPANPLVGGILMRKARDENGVAAGADAAVATAAGSAGSALPDPIMRKFESSLGADLSSVRVHTGGESAAAAHSVGARAYTTGQDIHFAAGQYDPGSQSGQHLLAHEVAHTVQQRGGAPTRQNKLEVSTPGDAFEHEADRAADAMVSSRPAQISSASGLMRKPGDPGDNSHGSTMPFPPDMDPLDWRVIGATPGPDMPTPIAIAVQEAPPLPPGVSFDPSFGGADPHQAKPASVFDTTPKYSNNVFDMRRSVWDAFKSSIHSVETIYNTGAGPICSFNDAAKNPVLAQLYEMQLDGKPGQNLNQVANKQVVPRTNASGKTVGGLFDQSGPASIGTKADTSGLDGAMANAAKNPAVEAAITNLHAKDAALASSMEGMNQAQLEASAAGHAAQAAKFEVDKADATDRAEDAAAAQKAIQDKIDTIKKYVGGALSVVSFVGGMAAGPAAVAGGLIQLGDQVGAYKPTDAAPKSGGAAAAEGIGKGAGSPVASAIAEKIIGYIYQADLDKQAANLKQANADFRAARKGSAGESMLAASDILASKLAGMKKCAEDMKSKLLERKNAYQSLATAAATAGGGSQEDQDRMKALIMAIPVAKAVVSQASTVLNIINNQPDYNVGSAMGYHMAVNAKSNMASDIMNNYSHILSYRETFKGHFDFWSARVNSLEGVIGKLEGK